jgi:hypothetical protein
MMNKLDRFTVYSNEKKKIKKQSKKKTKKKTEMKNK